MTSPRTAIRQVTYTPQRFSGAVLRAGARYSFVGSNVDVGVSATDALTHSMGVAVSVDATTSDALLLYRKLSLADGVGVATAATSVLAAASSASDEVRARVAVVLGVTDSISDTVEVSDAAGLAAAWAVQLADTVVGTGALAGTMTSTRGVEDTLTISDVAVAGFVEVLADSVAAAAALLGVATASVTVTEVVTLTDELTNATIKLALLTDTVEAADVPVTSLAALQAILDQVVVQVQIVAPTGEVYTGWVYSPDTPAATEIAGYDFFALGNHPLGTLAARSDGVYVLGGTTDDGAAIPWYLRTGKLPLGTMYQKRPEYVYVTGVTEGAMTLRVKTTGNAQGEIEGEYTFPVTSIDGVPDNFRAEVGKGMRGAYIQMTLFGDADVSLSQLMLQFARTKRRV